jgi:hypothetical protein
LAGSDADGPAVDIVRIAPGTSVDVADVSTSGRYLVTSAGLRYPVHDSAIAALGLSSMPAEAPWSILGALPAGPRLDRDAALIGRDVVVATP